MKIRPAVAKLFPEHRQTDGTIEEQAAKTTTGKLTVAYSKFTNSLK